MKFRNKKQQLVRKLYPFQIKCTCCANLYSNPYNCDQGHTCASYLYQSKDEGYIIHSVYGSGYDTMRFFVKNSNIVKKKHIINKKQKGIKADDRNIVVCDNCISKFFNNNSIKNDEDYDAFAFIDILNSFHAEDPERYFEKLTEGGPNDCIRLINEERKNRKVVKVIKLANRLF